MVSSWHRSLSRTQLCQLKSPSAYVQLGTASALGTASSQTGWNLAGDMQVHRIMSMFDFVLFGRPSFQMSWELTQNTERLAGGHAGASHHHDRVAYLKWLAEIRSMFDFVLFGCPSFQMSWKLTQNTERLAGGHAGAADRHDRIAHPESAG